MHIKSITVFELLGYAIVNTHDGCSYVVSIKVARELSEEHNLAIAEG